MAPAGGIRALQALALVITHSKFISSPCVCVFFNNYSNLFLIFSSPEQLSGRAVVLPLASALALVSASASTNVQILC